MEQIPQVFLSHLRQMASCISHLTSPSVPQPTRYKRDICPLYTSAYYKMAGRPTRSCPQSEPRSRCMPECHLCQAFHPSLGRETEGYPVVAAVRKVSENSRQHGLNGATRTSINRSFLWCASAMFGVVRGILWPVTPEVASSSLVGPAI